MKKTLTILWLLVSVFRSNALTEKIPFAFDKNVEEFLITTAEQHMLTLQEGEVAIDQGTIAELKAFGELLVKEKSALLSEVRSMAAARNVVLPESLGKECSDELKELKTKKGVSFNKLFVKHMQRLHKQAFSEFTRASEHLADKEVAAFAAHHLNEIHLGLLRLEKMKRQL